MIDAQLSLATSPFSAAYKEASKSPVEAAHNTTEAPAQINSDLLLQGARLLHIVHNGQTYQLRATRLGKLILTK